MSHKRTLLKFWNRLRDELHDALLGGHYSTLEELVVDAALIEMVNRRKMTQKHENDMDKDNPAMPWSIGHEVHKVPYLATA